MSKPLTYKDSGVDVSKADAAKLKIAGTIVSATSDNRVLNRPGAFASLYHASFPGISDPVLVLKAEEPGSKQLLAFRFGRIRSICSDLINHLVNDIVVMGARPLAVLDTIVCSGLDAEVVTQLVSGMAEACRDNGCTLVGGETSEQPGVLAEKSYVLCASVLGVVDRSCIVDGSKIAKGDVVLALASNGPHTNGYTLIRKLIAQDQQILERRVGDTTFLDAVMEPHRAYLPVLEPLLDGGRIKGMAHITGGGIAGNLNRILPSNLSAMVDLTALRIPHVFALIRAGGNVPDDDMLKTFNLGVGIAMVVAASDADEISAELNRAGCETYSIGTIADGTKDVRFSGTLRWP